MTNPNYQREGHLVLQDFSHAIRHPNDNEIIYAEPFAPLPVKSGNDTRLTSLTGSGGASLPETTSNIYQSLKGKSAESGKIIYKTEITFVNAITLKVSLLFGHDSLLDGNYYLPPRQPEKAR